MKIKMAKKIGWLSFVVLVASTATPFNATAQTTTAVLPVEAPPVPFTGTFSQDYSPKDSAIKVSDPVELTFKFTHSVDAEIVPPEMLPSQRWHIVDTKTQNNPLNASEKETILNMTVSVNRPGATTLPPLKFIALDRAGKSSEIVSAPISLKFISSLPDTIDLAFKPPKPPVEIWVENFTLAWIGGIGLIAGLFLALFMFMKNRRVVIEIPEPPRAAHDVALEKLASVAGNEISEDDEKNMAFYVLISEAIREYMGSIWNFPGTELTTTEILQHLKEKVFPLGISQDDIGTFLKETDYVKFAGSKPDNESNARILRRAFSIIELTKTLSFSQYTTQLAQFREIYGSETELESRDGNLAEEKPEKVEPTEPVQDEIEDDVDPVEDIIEEGPENI